MGNAKAKTINLLLYEGDLGGVISIEDSSWNSGELYSAPRESISELIDSEACNKYGVYLLLSQDMVYVGQSSDLAKRLNQHKLGKDWWESVVVLTTKDDSLNRSDIDYLESVLIERAREINHLDCDNKNKGNPPRVDKFRKVVLDQYLKEALFLMQLIGITVFSDIKARPSKVSKSTSLINTIDVTSKLAFGTRAKATAISFLKDNGIELTKHVTYAVKQAALNLFWSNPNINYLSEEWDIILNDNILMELIVLRVPANTLSLKNGSRHGLVVRHDKPNQIELKIDASSLSDKTSNTDFSRFVVTRIKYGNND